MRPRSTLAEVATGTLLLIVLAIGSGCSTTKGGIFGWWAARGERAATRAEAKAKTAEADVLAIAQRNVEEMLAALNLAPASRAVDVAREAGRQASANLGQLLGPLTAERLAQIETRAQALVSEDEKVRDRAEADRATERKTDAAAVEELITLRRDLAAERERANTIAAKNAELAGKYLWAQWAAYAGAAGSVLLGLAALAMRFNLGGANAALADIIATVRRRSPEAAGLVTAAADAALSRGQQQKIFKLVTALQAQRTDTSAA